MFERVLKLDPVHDHIIQKEELLLRRLGTNQLLRLVLQHFSHCGPQLFIYYPVIILNLGFSCALKSDRALQLLGRKLLPSVRGFQLLRTLILDLHTFGFVKILLYRELHSIARVVLEKGSPMCACPYLCLVDNSLGLSQLELVSKPRVFTPGFNHRGGNCRFGDDLSLY